MTMRFVFLSKKIKQIPSLLVLYNTAKKKASVFFNFFMPNKRRVYSSDRATYCLETLFSE